MTAVSRWILRAPLRDAKRLGELRPQIFALALLPGADEEIGTEIFAISDAIDLSETSGRPDALILLVTRGEDPRVAALLGGLRKRADVSLEPDRQLVSFAPTGEKRAHCGSLDIPQHNPGAASVHVAVIEGASVKGRPEWEVKRFAVSDGGVEELASAPLGDPAHATYVADFLMGANHGAAKGAKVWSYRLDTGMAWEMVKAMEHIRDHTPVRVVCSAMGVDDTIPNIDALHTMVANLALRTSRPIFFVASAGNDTTQVIGSPGAAPEAITIGVHRGAMVTSSHGVEGSGKPTLVAHVDSDVATLDHGTCWLGTSSVTAPYVAGCIATWLHLRPRLTREELHHVLVTASKRESDQDRLYYGHGIVDLNHALTLVSDMTRNDAPTPPRAPYHAPPAIAENVPSPGRLETPSSP